MFFYSRKIPLKNLIQLMNFNDTERRISHFEGAKNAGSTNAVYRTALEFIAVLKLRHRLDLHLYNNMQLHYKLRKFPSSFIKQVTPEFLYKTFQLIYLRYFCVVHMFNSFLKKFLFQIEIYTFRSS